MLCQANGNGTRHEKTVSESKMGLLWEPWEEDETPRKELLKFLGFYFSVCW